MSQLLKLILRTEFGHGTNDWSILKFWVIVTTLQKCPAPLLKVFEVSIFEISTRKGNHANFYADQGILKFLMMS